MSRLSQRIWLPFRQRQQTRVSPPLSLGVRAQEKKAADKSSESRLHTSDSAIHKCTGGGVAKTELKRRRRLLTLAPLYQRLGTHRSGFLSCRKIAISLRIPRGRGFECKRLIALLDRGEPHDATLGAMASVSGDDARNRHGVPSRRYRTQRWAGVQAGDYRFRFPNPDTGRG